MTQIHTMQFVATVRLVKALGGGFDAGATRAKPNERNQQG
jgi:hypothetical protein